jgi:hypothetical protein
VESCRRTKWPQCSSKMFRTTHELRVMRRARTRNGGACHLSALIEALVSEAVSPRRSRSRLRGLRGSGPAVSSHIAGAMLLFGAAGRSIAGRGIRVSHAGLPESTAALLDCESVSGGEGRAEGGCF